MPGIEPEAFAFAAECSANNTAGAIFVVEDQK